MSGKIAANSGFVTKAEFARLQTKVDSLVSKITEGEGHTRIRNEFNKFQVDATADIRSLQKSVKDIEDLIRSLEKFVNESISDLQRNIDCASEHVVKNTSRPDQQSDSIYLRNGVGAQDIPIKGKLVTDELTDGARRYSRQLLRKHTTVM